MPGQGHRGQEGPLPHPGPCSGSQVQPLALLPHQEPGLVGHPFPVLEIGLPDLRGLDLTAAVQGHFQSHYAVARSILGNRHLGQGHPGLRGVGFLRPDPCRLKGRLSFPFRAEQANPEAASRAAGMVFPEDPKGLPVYPCPGQNSGLLESLAGVQGAGILPQPVPHDSHPGVLGPALGGIGPVDPPQPRADSLGLRIGRNQGGQPSPGGSGPAVGQLKIPGPQLHPLTIGRRGFLRNTVGPVQDLFPAAEELQGSHPQPGPAAPSGLAGSRGLTIQGFQGQGPRSPFHQGGGGLQVGCPGRPRCSREADQNQQEDKKMRRPSLRIRAGAAGPAAQRPRPEPLGYRGHHRGRYLLGRFSGMRAAFPSRSRR